MKGIVNYFSVSQEYTDIAEIPFKTNALLFHGLNNEERSEISSNFQSRHSSVELIYVDELDDQLISCNFVSGAKHYSLRSKEHASNFSRELEGQAVYVDITGLTHNVWAWLIRAILYRDSGNFWVLYSEPVEYKFHDAPLDGQMFDLSEKINGIAPLTGMARLAHYRNNNFLFMPLLGFEGTRLAHIMEDVQPSKEHTFPIIGVPGFNYNFPFYTYQGNRLTLEREGIWKNWRYEKANCPVSIFTLGQELLEEYPDMFLRIAPIGTKPHALGAVLLKLANPKKVDIVYDHPIRKKGRTKGKSKTLQYWLTPFSEVINERW